MIYSNNPQQQQQKDRLRELINKKIRKLSVTEFEEYENLKLNRKRRLKEL
jgi:hypothetical protein